MPHDRRGPQQGRGRDYQQRTVADDIASHINSLPDLGSYLAVKLVDDAIKLAGHLHGEIKSAQIRKIYGTVKSLEMEFQNAGHIDPDKIVLLRPKFAYAANKKSEVRDLQIVLDACLQRIKSRKDFDRFVDFFEAILAYHR